MSLDALFTLFAGLPRAGPGSDASTRKAIDRLPALPASPRILDIGCGPGKQTLVLAAASKTPVVAVDIHQPFLDHLAATAAEVGLSHLVEPCKASMDALEFAPGSFDLIWSEGAVFIIGVAEALRLWRPLLRPGGLLAFTEATWLTDDPAPEVADFWQECYPAMGTVAGNVAVAEARGYRGIDTFTLPDEDWWDEYYVPLGKRVAELRPQCEPGSDLAGVLDETEREMAMFRRHGDSFGYVFYLLRKGGA